MSESLDKIKNYRKQVLFELYEQLQPLQKEKFNLFFKSVDEISPDKIDHAILLCERTILNNKQKLYPDDITE